MSEAWIDTVRRRGWATSKMPFGNRQHLEQAVLQTCAALGSDISLDRYSITTLMPKANVAKPSLSKAYGLGSLPFHCDTAHWMVPVRYIVLACIEPGRVSVPTNLLHCDNLGFTATEENLARTSVFYVGNGRRSFYTTVLDRKNRFIRVDLGCMIPVDEEGSAVLQQFSLDRHQKRSVSIDWLPGQILVLDNWRVLHCRANQIPADQSRILLRAYVQ